MQIGEFSFALLSEEAHGFKPIQHFARKKTEMRNSEKNRYSNNFIMPKHAFFLCRKSSCDLTTPWVVLTPRLGTAEVERGTGKGLSPSWAIHAEHAGILDTLQLNSVLFS